MTSRALTALCVFCGGVLAVTKCAAAQDNTRVRIVVSHAVSATMVLDWVNAFERTSSGAGIVAVAEERPRTDGIRRFVKGEYDVLVYPGPEFSAMERLWIEWKLPGALGSLEEYLAGQMRILAVTHRTNPVSQVTIGQLREVIAARRKPIGWGDLGGWNREILLHVPIEESWAHQMLKAAILANIDGVAGTIVGWEPVRPDAEEDKSGQETIENTIRDVKALGLLQWIGGLDTKGVKVLSIGKGEGSPFVAPLLEPRIQHDYPLSELCILYLHPKAGEAAREFCKFAVGEKGATIAAKYGLVTSWHEREFLGSGRVKAMKAGKGAHIRMVGDALFAEAAQDLAVAYVRAKEPIQLHYVPRAPGIDAGYINRFVTAAKRKQDYDMPLFLCRGPIASEDAKDLAGLKQYTLAASAPVVVVNAASDIQSLTPAAVAKIFTGQVTKWDAVSDATGRIAACVLKKDPAVGRYVRRHGAGRIPPAIHRCGDRRGIFGRIASDVKAIGLVGAAQLAGDRDTRLKGLRVVPIEGAEGPVVPRAKTIMSGAYPLAAVMHACVAGDAGEAAADLVAFLRSRDAQAAFEACGMITAATRLYLPGEGENAAPGIPTGEHADQGQTGAAQDKNKEEHTVPESAESDGVGGLPFD